MRRASNAPRAVASGRPSFATRPRILRFRPRDAALRPDAGATASCVSPLAPRAHALRPDEGAIGIRELPPTRPLVRTAPRGIATHYPIANVPSPGDATLRPLLASDRNERLGRAARLTFQDAPREGLDHESSATYQPRRGVACHHHDLGRLSHSRAIPVQETTISNKWEGMAAVGGLVKAHVTDGTTERTWETRFTVASRGSQWKETWDYREGQSIAERISWWTSDTNSVNDGPQGNWNPTPGHSMYFWEPQPDGTSRWAAYILTEGS